MRVKFSPFFWTLGLLALHASPWTFGQTETPNPGPRSDAQANLLFTEGNQFLSDKKFSNATQDFEQLIARYPSFDRITDAYLSLLESLFGEQKHEDLRRYSKELLSLNPQIEKANRARQYEAQADLNLRSYVEARLVADELLKHSPTSRQKAVAFSIKFQSFLEEKQYGEAHSILDALTELNEKEKIDVYVKLIPEFNLTLATRECTISHLLKNKSFEEDELTEYFSKKNLCFKSALPNAVNGMSDAAVLEWCEAFTFLNHELESMKIDKFLKDKINQDLKSTFDFAKTISPGFYKCYEPYKPPKSAKSKKRHRKRSVSPS